MKEEHRLIMFRKAIRSSSPHTVLLITLRQPLMTVLTLNRLYEERYGRGPMPKDILCLYGKLFRSVLSSEYHKDNGELK